MQNNDLRKKYITFIVAAAIRFNISEECEQRFLERNESRQFPTIDTGASQDRSVIY